MNKANVLLIIIILSLTVSLVVFLELYVLPEKQTEEVFERVTLVHVQGSRQSYDVPYLLTSSGRRYHVPDNLDLRLQQGQPFIVQKTFLFSRFSSFVWSEGQDQCFVQHINPLRVYYFSLALHIILTAFALYLLFRLKTGRLKKITSVYLLAGLAIAFIIYFLVD